MSDDIIKKLTCSQRLYRFSSGIRKLLNMLIERKKGHFCDIDMYEQTCLEKPIEKFGVRECGYAVCECFESNGKLFVYNFEFCNQVNFCPFCGAKAEKTVGLNNKMKLKEKYCKGCISPSIMKDRGRNPCLDCGTNYKYYLTYDGKTNRENIAINEKNLTNNRGSLITNAGNIVINANDIVALERRISILEGEKK